MRRPGKTIIIIAICFLIFGILLSIGAGITIHATGRHWSGNISTYDDAIPHSIELGSLTSLTLNLVNEPIFIRRGGDMVLIEWSQRYDGQYRVSQQGDSVTLSRSTGSSIGFGSNWFSFGFLGRNFNTEDASGRPVTVTIPEGVNLRSLNISGADIRLNIDGINADDIDISGANVIADIRDTISRELDISGANAIVSLMNISARSVDISGANAETTLTTPGLEQWNFDVSGLNAELWVNGQRVRGDFNRVTGQGAADSASGFTFGSANSIQVSGVNAVLTIIEQQ